MTKHELQKKHQPAIDAIKAALQSVSYPLNKVKLKASPYGHSLDLCIGWHNEAFDEGQPADDATYPLVASHDIGICADVSGGGTVQLSWN